jgi:putative membrane protein
MTGVEAKSSNDLAVERTQMAAGRTMMAADRTLMAWIRTSLSLMSFGFTIYKLLQGFQAGGAELPHSDSPRRIGLFLTGLGAAAVVMGTIEYAGVLRELRKTQHYRLLRPTFVLAIIMAAASVFLFVGILAKVL